jgi:hypothetical protein
VTRVLASRRGLVVVVVLLAVAAAALFATTGEPVAKGGALFCLAAIGGVLATRRLGRRLVGVGVVVVGAVVVVVGDRTVVRLSGLLMLLAGVLVAWFGPGWSELSSRYDAGGGTGPGGGAPARRPHDLWDALDRGEDPTA